MISFNTWIGPLTGHYHEIMISNQLEAGYQNPSFFYMKCT